MKELKILLLTGMITLFTTFSQAAPVNMAPIISYLLSDTQKPSLSELLAGNTFYIFGSSSAEGGNLIKFTFNEEVTSVSFTAIDGPDTGSHAVQTANIVDDTLFIGTGAHVLTDQTSDFLIFESLKFYFDETKAREDFAGDDITTPEPSLAELIAGNTFYTFSSSSAEGGNLIAFTFNDDVTSVSFTAIDGPDTGSHAVQTANIVDDTLFIGTGVYVLTDQTSDFLIFESLKFYFDETKAREDFLGDDITTPEPPNTDIFNNIVSLHQGTNLETPKVDLNTQGDAIATWIDNNKVYASRFISNVWSTPELIQSDTNYNAVGNQVAIDSNGNAIAVWVQTEGLIDKIWVNRFDTHTGWGEAQRLTNARGSEDNQPQIVMDSEGNALIVWSDRDHINVSRYNVTSHTFEPYANIAINGDRGDHLHPRVKMDALGNAIVVWEQYDQYSRTYIVWVAQYNKTSNLWSMPESIYNQDIGLMGETLTLGVTSQGKAMIAWSQLSFQSIWTSYYNGSWTTQKLIDNTAYSLPHISTQGENVSIVYGDNENIKTIKFDTGIEQWRSPEHIHTNDSRYLSSSLNTNGDLITLFGSVRYGDTYEESNFYLNFNQNGHTILLGEVGYEWNASWHTNEGTGLGFQTVSSGSKTVFIWIENNSIKSLIY